MKKVFLDTNIIVDLIADRKPFSKYAIEIFNKAEVKKIRKNQHGLDVLTFLIAFGILVYVPCSWFMNKCCKPATRKKHRVAV